VVTADPEKAATGTQIWFLSQPSGEVRQITNDLGGYGSVSLGVTADAKTIVTVQDDWSAQIWLVTPSADTAPAKRLTTGKYDGPYGIFPARDGRIVYSRKTGQNVDLWVMNADGSDNRQLTSDAFIERAPEFSRDGRYIVFKSDRAGSGNIWRMDADGNNPKQLTSTPGDSYDPDCTPDGQWVVFTLRRGGTSTLWKVPMNGGTRVQLTDYQSWGPLVSPDGKTIACLVQLDADKPPKLGLVPIDGGAPTKTFDIPDNLSVWRWAPDGTAVTFAEGTQSGFKIWKQNLDGSKSAPLVNIKDFEMYDFGWTADGKQLIISYGPRTDDVILMRDFR
jgi:Tol biopolymer transport system component